MEPTGDHEFGVHSIGVGAGHEKLAKHGRHPTTALPIVRLGPLMVTLPVTLTEKTEGVPEVVKENFCTAEVTVHVRFSVADVPSVREPTPRAQIEATYE